MAKRRGALSSNHKLRSPHKTKKRLAAKAARLAAQQKKR